MGITKITSSQKRLERIEKEDLESRIQTACKEAGISNAVIYWVDGTKCPFWPVYGVVIEPLSAAVNDTNRNLPDDLNRSEDIVYIMQPQNTDYFSPECVLINGKAFDKDKQEQLRKAMVAQRLSPRIEDGLPHVSTLFATSADKRYAEWKYLGKPYRDSRGCFATPPKPKYTSNAA